MGSEHALLNTLKMKGFTIIETLLALILAGVLALMAGSVYAYFHRIQLRELGKASALRQVQFFDFQLQQDIDKGCNFGLADHLLIIRDCQAHLLVRYIFVENRVIRVQENRQDTFRLKAQLFAAASGGSGQKTLRIHLPANDTDLLYQSLPYSRVYDEPTED